jgi:hypothetical protein
MNLAHLRDRVYAEAQRVRDCGHGWVHKNASGAVARCGGPRICAECALDQAVVSAVGSGQGYLAVHRDGRLQWLDPATVAFKADGGAIFDCSDALHASAPGAMKCADCTMGAPEPCWPCYRAWWERRHPEHRFVP